MFNRFLLSAVLLLAVLISVPTTINAQDDASAQTWFFATDATQESGPLLAFNAEGDVRTLIETGVNASNHRAWRLGPQLALGFLIVNNTPTLYRLTPDAATPFQSDSELADGDELMRSAVLTGYQAPYAVIATSFVPPSAPALLANLETGTLELLSGSVGLLPLEESPAFSADGTTLRYLSWDDTEFETFQFANWRLMSRDLATGEEHIVNELGEVQRIATRDRHGERWMQWIIDRDTETLTYTMYHVDGTSEILDELSIADGSPSVSYRFADDYLLTYDPNCEADCSLSLRPLDDGPVLEMVVPELAFSFQVLRWVDESHVVVLVDEALWYLGSDGSAELIGYRNPQHIFVQPDELVSPDGRWILAIDDPDDPTAFFVWDTTTQSPLVQGEIDVGATIRYSEGGFLAANIRFEKFAVYTDATGEVAWIDTPDRALFVDVLPDGAILATQYVESEGRSPGIYLYDSTQDTFTLLIENAVPINMATFRN